MFSEVKWHSYLKKSCTETKLMSTHIIPTHFTYKCPSNSATHSVGLNLWVCVEQCCPSWCCSSSTPPLLHSTQQLHVQYQSTLIRYRHVHCVEWFSQWVSDFILLLIIHSNQLTSWYLVKKHYNPLHSISTTLMCSCSTAAVLPTSELMW